MVLSVLTVEVSPSRSSVPPDRMTLSSVTPSSVSDLPGRHRQRAILKRCELDGAVAAHRRGGAVEVVGAAQQDDVVECHAIQRHHLPRRHHQFAVWERAIV